MRRLGRVLLGLLATGFALLAYVYLTLPDVRLLATGNPATTAFIELRAAEARAKGQSPKRRQIWVPYARISQHLKRAVLVAEDDRFWQHEGLDYEAMKESIQVDLEKGRFSRGGSTITQQLAKNLYLSPSKNPLRKLREVIIARRLETALTKRRILELYLNVIEWGDGIYGAEAAARAYFRTSAAALGPEQSSMLAAAIINPRLYSPAHPNARLLRRQRLILRRMGSVTPPPVIPAPGEPIAPATLPAGAAPAPEETPEVAPSSPPRESPPTTPTQPEGTPVAPDRPRNDQK